jgi:hypothetical protein
LYAPQQLARARQERSHRIDKALQIGIPSSRRLYKLVALRISSVVHGFPFGIHGSAPRPEQFGMSKYKPHCRR